MAIATGSALTWSIIVTFFHAVAIGSTSFRLFHRFRIGRLWWDDYLAALALVLDTLYFTMLWARYKLNVPGGDVELRASLYIVSALCYFFIVWISRISMCLSLTRLIPTQSKMRRLTNGCAIAFAILLVALMVQYGVLCGGDLSWKQSPAVVCTGTSWASALTCDVLGDVFLMVAPLILLWRGSIAKKHRSLVLTVFAASILTTLASVALHTFLLGPATWKAARLVVMLSHVEATIALTVANLLVVVAFLSTRKSHEDLEADETFPADMSVNPASKTVIGAYGDEDEKASQSTK